MDNIIVIVGEEIIAHTMPGWKFVCLHSLLILSKINNFIIAPKYPLLKVNPQRSSTSSPREGIS